MTCVFCSSPALWYVHATPDERHGHPLNVCGRHLNTAVGINASTEQPAIAHRNTTAPSEPSEESAP